MLSTSQNPNAFVRIILIGVAVALFAASCGGSGDEQHDEGLSVVVTTTIWGDVVRSITRDDATVTVLMPIGVDPHEYVASSSQVARIQMADLVVANGLGLEDRLIDVLDAAKSDGANVLTIADNVDPIPFGVSGEHAGSGLDPHVWFDPERVAAGAILIADALVTIDDSIDWHSRPREYGTQIMQADAEVSAELMKIPADLRKLVTNHDSLGYLADRYGFEVIGTVIPGGATLSRPSSADLAELVSVIERENVLAIFAESTEPTVLAEAVAKESGHKVAVIDLFTGSLGDEMSGADTLIGLLLTDALRISAALR
jgi:zinc/manganese transport system substrate-binding protein